MYVFGFVDRWGQIPFNLDYVLAFKFPYPSFPLVSSLHIRIITFEKKNKIVPSITAHLFHVQQSSISKIQERPIHFLHWHWMWTQFSVACWSSGWMAEIMWVETVTLFLPTQTWCIYLLYLYILLSHSRWLPQGGPELSEKSSVVRDV